MPEFQSHDMDLRQLRVHSVEVERKREAASSVIIFAYLP